VIKQQPALSIILFKQANFQLKPMQMPRRIHIVLFLFVLVFSRHAVATSVLPVSLQQMATAADLVFHGRVISNEVRQDQASGHVATFTTFEIIERVKGETGPTHTVKQIGGHIPGSRVRQVIQGVPRFSVGEEYVVFLPRASSLGFASPIGLSQGKFNVHRQNGEAVISNANQASAEATPHKHADQAKQLSAFEVERPGSPRLPEFLQSVRGMIGE
jgi:hypothetical protein